MRTNAEIAEFVVRMIGPGDIGYCSVCGTVCGGFIACDCGSRELHPRWEPASDNPDKAREATLAFLAGNDLK